MVPGQGSSFLCTLSSAPPGVFCCAILRKDKVDFGAMIVNLTTYLYVEQGRSSMPVWEPVESWRWHGAHPLLTHTWSLRLGRWAHCIPLTQLEVGFILFCHWGLNTGVLQH